MSSAAAKKTTVFRFLGDNEHAILTVLALVVGLAGGMAAFGFRYLILLFQSLAYGADRDLLSLLPTVPWYVRLVMPVIGGLVVGPLVYFWAREAKGHGVPEVMEAVALKNGLIRKRLVVVKSLASAICIGTGGAVGREGPIVQIGSAIGSTIGQMLRASADRMRTLVGCGAAAGIAATFNAPMAGSMFALEIILADFGLANFSPIVISSVSATAVSRYLMGDAPAFIVPAYKLVSAWEFPLYVVLGLGCALVAIGFIRALYRLEDLFDNLRIPDYLKAATGGVMLGVTGLIFPHVLGVGYGAIDLSLAQNIAWWLMLLLVAVKILATAITIGSGGSGGIFAPSLFLGAMTGGAFGVLVHALFPHVTATPGAYGIVGMGAVVSATTHGPLTAILMLFEMTGDYKIILPLMVACIISTIIAQQLLPQSIYTLKMARKGIDLEAGREVNILKALNVEEIMISGMETVFEGMSMGRLEAIIAKSKYNSFPVVDGDNRLTGILSYLDYSEAVFNEHLKDLVIVKDIATTKVVTVSTTDNLYSALEKISVKDFSILPVVSPKERDRLVGVLTRRDIIGAYNQAVLKKSLLNPRRVRSR